MAAEDHPIHVTENVDVHYSPDDGGWYAQDYRTDATSVIYGRALDAVKAVRSDEVKWDA